MAVMAILWEIVSRFGSILGAPLKQPDMLWILLPIYLNWVFTDYFQERKGTDFGNAITNGVVTLWVGLDWARQSIKDVVFNAAFATRILICVFFAIYGLIIMVESARAKPIAHYIGRVREISYFAIVATPIFYGVIEINLITIAAILLFFPIWYGIGEAFDRLLPAPPGEDAMSQPDMKLPDLEPGPSSGAGAMPSMPEMPKFLSSFTILIVYFKKLHANQNPWQKF
ncbi:MAG: hypothetical protein NTY99_02935 [DPANN group archaeon]|nr:hypothetical protein [DPANN group archaeon]